MVNPFKDKSAEEVLDMFIQSPGEETKKTNMYMSAINVKSAGEVKEMISNLKGTIENFTHIVKRYTDSANTSSRNMLFLTIVLAFAALIQALSGFAQWKVSESAIEVQRAGNGLEDAKWQYEMTRNDRLEARDIDWRRKDLEFQGRLP